MKTIFFRVLEADDKAAVLLAAIRAPKTAAQGITRFDVDAQSFRVMPRSPFAYWVSERLRRLFAELPVFEADGRTAKQGLPTANDFRFVRLTCEVSPSSVQRVWFPFAKGGAFSTFYGPTTLVVDWEEGGRRPRAAYETRTAGGSWGGFGHNEQSYFRTGLTWPRRTNGLSLRVLPAGCVFGDKGPAAFVAGNDADELLALAAVMNSGAFGYLVSLQLARTELAQSYEVGLLQQTPVPRLTSPDRARLAVLARGAWWLKRSIDTHNETSHAFTLPTLLQVDGRTLAARSTAWGDRKRDIETQLAAIQTEVDARCFDLYSIDEADRRAITEGFGSNGADADEIDEDIDTEPDDPPDTADTTTLTADLISWAAGVAFGRFDIRLATGERPIPPEPEPFDPLPTHSPGMLSDPYPSWRVGTLKSPPAHLVDDLGHPTLDLTAAVRAVFDTVFGDDAHARYREAAALLDPKDHEIRNWLSRGFFEHHLKRYSKSRRKAPVLWQLATVSSRYAVWLYAHRVTADTFFQVQNDLVAPKLAHEERMQNDLLRAAGTSPSASQRKEIDEQAGVVEELRTMLDEVKRIAPLWSPDLDDGIVLTMAPLWRLVPQHKAWQKELRAAWEALAAGKYDWAHLAMHLWPERVVPKCLTDRSLAIAHGLEDRLWVQDFDEKWRLRLPLDKTIAHVVHQHRSRTLEEAVDALRAFWKTRFADAGRSDAAFWTELSTGVHDDAPLALAWWPRRVREKAAKDPAIARAHRLETETWLPDAEPAAAAAGKRRKARPDPAPALSPAQLEKVAAFCGDLEGYPTWAARWRAWDEGAFDGRALLALPVRTEAAVKLAAEDYAVAVTFGLERWFWLKTDAGARRLGAPEAEVEQALGERQSSTVKAALKSLEEAPTAGGGGAKRGRKGKS